MVNSSTIQHSKESSILTHLDREIYGNLDRYIKSENSNLSVPTHKELTRLLICQKIKSAEKQGFSQYKTR